MDAKAEAGGRHVAAGVSPAVEPGILPGGTSPRIPKASGYLQIAEQRAFFPGGKMPPSTAARMAAATLNTYAGMLLSHFECGNREGRHGAVPF